MLCVSCVSCLLAVRSFEEILCIPQDTAARKSDGAKMVCPLNLDVLPVVVSVTTPQAPQAKLLQEMHNTSSSSANLSDMRSDALLWFSPQDVHVWIAVFGRG